MTASFLTRTRSGINNIPQIVIGGLTPLTTIDYPEELAAVIFLQGCPWRCGYCQNVDLIPRKNPQSISWPEVIDLLKKRISFLDAVVFSGGEPTLHLGLQAAISQVKSLGYKIGLHTAGIYPDRLESLLPLIDWVGMDIKSAKVDYPQITGVTNSAQKAWKSARILIESGVAHEFRTTIHPDMLSRDMLLRLVDELVEIGGEHFVIQECVTKHCMDEALRVKLSVKPDSLFLNKIGQRFKFFSVREA